MPCIKNSILDEIQKKREIMIDLAQKNGFTSDDTIKCSQELDQLIYQYYIKPSSILLLILFSKMSPFKGQ